MSDEVLRIVDRGDHFEPKGLWYENVEERVLRDLRKLLKTLGGEARRPVLRDWIPRDEELHLRTRALRAEGRSWVWTELSEGVERFVVELDGAELHAVLEKERTADRWTFTLVTREQRALLPAPGLSVASAGEVRLEPPSVAEIRGEDGSLRVQHARPTLDGEELPEGCVLIEEVLDRGEVVALGHLDELEAPLLRLRSNLVVDGVVLCSPPVPLAIRTSFTGLGRLEVPLHEIPLQGHSLRPARLALVLHHHLGERTDRVELQATRRGGAYLLEPPWRPRMAPIGELAVEVVGQGEVGRCTLEPGPLRARWEHPEARGAAPSPTSVELQPLAPMATRWTLDPLGRVHYPETGQTGALDDLAFEPLLAATHEDAEALLRRGAVKAWAPGQHPVVLQAAADLDALRLLSGTARLGRGPGRGVHEAGGGWARELRPVGGRFQLPDPGRMRVWHRGLVLDGTLVELGESGQLAFELDEPRPVLDLAELGPFHPLRGWRDGDRLRLVARGHDEVLELGDELRGPGVRYLYEGYGYDALLPAEPSERVAWRGCLLRGLRFAGWLIADELGFPAEGPFAAWSLGRRGAAPVAEGRPPEVQEAVDALLAGTRVATVVHLDSSEGRWTLRPRYAHPRRPPVRVDVEAPGESVDPTEPAVRIWVDE